MENDKEVPAEDRNYIPNCTEGLVNLSGLEAGSYKECIDGKCKYIGNCKEYAGFLKNPNILQ